ncbi:hypothetical protein HDU67_008791 [Dinochytrium kinnereticum]|nr:hypothetical protein HDU67_008791 [Dinochytrium kinnereticum]
MGKSSTDPHRGDFPPLRKPNMGSDHGRSLPFNNSPEPNHGVGVGNRHHKGSRRDQFPRNHTIDDITDLHPPPILITSSAPPIPSMIHVNPSALREALEGLRKVGGSVGSVDLPQKREGAVDHLVAERRGRIPERKSSIAHRGSGSGRKAAPPLKASVSAEFLGVGVVSRERSLSSSPPPPVPPKDDIRSSFLSSRSSSAHRATNPDTKVQRQIDILLDRGAGYLLGPAPDLSLALETWNEAIELSNRVNDSIRKAKALNNVSCIFRRTGKIEKGFTALDEAWECAIGRLDEFLGETNQEGDVDDEGVHQELDEGQCEEDRERRRGLMRVLGLLRYGLSKKFEERHLSDTPTSSRKALKLLGIKKAPESTNEKAAKLLGLTESHSESSLTPDKVLKVLGILDGPLSPDLSIKRSGLGVGGANLSRSMSSLSKRTAGGTSSGDGDEGRVLGSRGSGEGSSKDSKVEALLISAHQRRDRFGPPLVVLFLDLVTSYGNMYFSVDKITESTAWHQAGLDIVQATLNRHPLPSEIDATPASGKSTRQFHLSYIHRNALMARARCLTHIGLCMQRSGDPHRSLLYHQRSLTTFTLFNPGTTQPSHRSIHQHTPKRRSLNSLLSQSQDHNHDHPIFHNPIPAVFSSIQGNLSSALFDLGRVVEAAKGFNGCGKEMEGLPWMINSACCLVEAGRVGGLGGVGEGDGWVRDLWRGLRMLFRALRVAEGLGEVENAGIARFNIASILLLLDHPHASLKILRSPVFNWEIILRQFRTHVTVQPLPSPSWRGPESITSLYNLSQTLFSILSKETTSTPSRPSDPTNLDDIFWLRSVLSSLLKSRDDSVGSDERVRDIPPTLPLLPFMEPMFSRRASAGTVSSLPPLTRGPTTPSHRRSGSGDLRSSNNTKVTDLIEILKLIAGALGGGGGSPRLVLPHLDDSLSRTHGESGRFGGHWRGGSVDENSLSPASISQRRGASPPPPSPQEVFSTPPPMPPLPLPPTSSPQQSTASAVALSAPPTITMTLFSSTQKPPSDHQTHPTPHSSRTCLSLARSLHLLSLRPSSSPAGPIRQLGGIKRPLNPLKAEARRWAGLTHHGVSPPSSSSSHSSTPLHTLVSSFGGWWEESHAILAFEAGLLGAALEGDEDGGVLENGVKVIAKKISVDVLPVLRAVGDDI